MIPSLARVFLGALILCASFSNTALAQSLVLWGPTTAVFYNLPVGESLVLTASADESQAPQLHGDKADQLGCRSVPASYQGSENNNAKWECTGLKSGNNSNSELFFTVGSDANRSDTIVIQVTAANVVCGYTPAGGGAQCESMSPNSCTTINGHAYTSLSACWGGETKPTFGSTCVIIQTSLEGTTYMYEIWNGGSMKKDPICVMDNARVQIVSGNARITHSTGDSMTVVAKLGSQFTVFADKGSESISRQVQVLDGTSQECSISTSVAEGTVRFDIQGKGGESQTYCHFDGNNYVLLSGDAKLLEMTEFSLTFDATKKGRIRVLAASPSTYSVDYEIHGGKAAPPSEDAVPPAGYEDEVLTNITDYTNPFPDTDLNDLSGKAAAELYRRAIIGGFPGGEFKGSKPVNRAEAAKFLLLARFQSVQEVDNNGRFPDVMDDQWYTKYVVTAADKGVINGHPSGLFKPADTVNAAEFLKMFSLTFGLELNMSHQFSDVPAASWFAQYAGIAQKYTLFPDRSSHLLPETPLTRADVAVAIYQYLSSR